MKLLGLSISRAGKTDKNPEESAIVRTAEIVVGPAISEWDQWLMDTPPRQTRNLDFWRREDGDFECRLAIFLYDPGRGSIHTSGRGRTMREAWSNALNGGGLLFL
jgi:hypothetical protein